MQIQPEAIERLCGRDLDVAVASMLGEKVLYIPHYSTEIEIAFELDGENWLWVFDEVFKPGALFISVRRRDETLEDIFNVLEIVDFSLFSCKETAYATARCRAWLKAKIAEAELSEV